MGDHYFSSNPLVESNRQRWKYILRDYEFLFETDNGVFSKREVDFGSRLLIESFEIPQISGDLLDIGCGYGPVGLALAKDFPDRKIDMVDINERAIELAKINKELNRVENVQIFVSNLFEMIHDKKYAAILSNPPIRAGKKVVHTIFEESKKYLKNGGELWVVIQKKQGAPSAFEKLQSLFDEVDIVTKKKGYFIIKAILK